MKTFKYQKINYKDLGPKQQENYNFYKVRNSHRSADIVQTIIIYWYRINMIKS